MSRFARIRRRPDHWSSAHERARLRAAERLDGPLGLAEATWLEEHLAGCPACTAIAASYDADRLALRGLGNDPPEPPRDLWARTAAAIERESTARGHSGPASSARRGARIPLGALSGIAVIAVVVAVSAVSGGLFNDTGGTTALSGLGTPAPGTTGNDPAGASTPEVAGAAPTPLVVGAGDVRWFGKSSDGQMAYNAASVGKVCRADTAADCAILDDPADERLALTASPKSIIGSPTQQQAIVVSDDGTGGQQVTVLVLPAATETPKPLASPPTEPSAPPTPTPRPGAADPTSSAPAPSDPAATVAPPTPDISPSPTEVGGDTAGSEPPATPEPSPSADSVPTPPLQPPVSPEPTVAASLAIASDIAVVGESAAFSADGAWFAFTARSVDGSSGPDIFVWHVGEATARPLTTDGASYFASWDGRQVVASRPGEANPDGSSKAVSVLVDPETGAERPAGDLWRPVVDPTRNQAVAWAGTVSTSADSTLVSPATGRLELRDWSSEIGSSSGDGPMQIVTDTPVGNFDVRWDETGTWFAAWVADPSGADVGRLSLYRVDRATGLLERPDGAPVDVPALTGFSIGEGRLAWATPPGQGGEGSRVQIVAWSPDGVGTVETAPGEDLIVVR